MKKSYFVLEGSFLLEVLKRAQGGEDADMLLAEIYANSEQQGKK